MGFPALNWHRGGRARSGKKENKTSRNPFSTKLSFETLEDRRLLATSLGTGSTLMLALATNEQVGGSGVAAITNGNSVVSSHSSVNGAVTRVSGMAGVSDGVYCDNGFIESNYVISGFGMEPAASGPLTPNDPYYSNQWGLSALNIEQAWTYNYGQGITVAVVDDGVDYNHEDLAANMWTNPVDGSHGANFYPDGNSSIFLNDYYGHGSVVAGVIAAVQNNGKGISGVAPESQIMALRIYPSTSTYDAEAVISAAINAIYYAVDHGARVINISSAFSFGFSGLEQPLMDACAYAKAHGDIIVAAAGNNNGNIPPFPNDFSDDVITVGGLDNSSGTITRWASSNFGPNLDFMAPAANIVSLRSSGSNWSWFNNDPGYQIGSGTSVAAPMVSGLVALLLAENPDQNFDDIYNRLKWSATDMGDPDFDNYYGWGMINPYVALEYDYYNDSIIKSYYTPQPDIYGIVRTDYADATGTGHIVINEYDSSGNRAVFTYYAGTSNVEEVDFFNSSNVLQRSNLYLADGITLDHRSYPNGDIDWYYSVDGLVRKHFSSQTGLTTEYLDENFLNTGIGRISKITQSSGAYTEYHGYYAGKNIACSVLQYNSTGTLTTTTHYDVFGAVIPGNAILTYYPDGTLETETFSSLLEYVYAYPNTLDIATTRQTFQGSSLLVDETFDSNGAIQQRTYPSGNIWNYYPTGRLKSVFCSSSGISYNYKDESFFDVNTGRLSKITCADNSCLIIDQYYLNSVQPLSVKKLDSGGNLIGTFQYDASGNLINSFGSYGQNEITTPSSSYAGLQVNSTGQMVWQSGTDIYFYNGVTTQKISTNLSKNVKIDGHWIAWQQYFSDTGNYEVVSYDSTAVPPVVNRISYNAPNSSATNFFLKINSQGKIIWSFDYNGSNYVYFYNNTSVILLYQGAKWSSNPQKPDIDESGDVVWQSGTTTTDPCTIYLKSGVGSSTPIAISADIIYAYKPSINSQGHVAFHGYRGADDYDIYFYDGSQVHQITSGNKINDVLPLLNDMDQIAWTGGQPGQNKEVYFYDGTIHQLTSDGMAHTLIGINNEGYVLWTRTNSSNTELWLWDGYQTRQLSSNASTYAMDKEGNISWVNVGSSEIERYTLPQVTSDITKECYPSGHLKSEYDAVNKVFKEYEDAASSRLLKETHLDGTFETYEYWESTDIVSKKELYNAGDLIQYRETFDVTGKSLTIEVMNGYSYKASSISTGTLTIGAGSVITITALPGGPQAQGTIQVIEDSTANAQADNAETNPVSSDAASDDPAVVPEPVFINQPLSEAVIVPVPAPSHVVFQQLLPVETVDAVSAPASIILDQSLPEENVDTISVSAPLVFEKSLPAEAKTVDTPPALASVALDMPLSARNVEKPSARSSNAMICDYLFSRPEQEALPHPAAANLALNDLHGIMTVAGPGKAGKARLVVDDALWEKSFAEQTVFTTASSGDAALQRMLPDDWNADWIWNLDLAKTKKRQKAKI